MYKLKVFYMANYIIMPKVLNYVESKGGAFYTAPVGSHPAIIVWVAELWTAMSEYWKDDRDQDLIRIFFEIEANVNTAKDWEEPKMEDKIFLVEQNYTCVVTKKSKLWKVISWVYGKQPSEIKWFTLDQLLWKKCVISVIHNESGYASIESVSTQSAKMVYHEQVRESFYFWINKDEWNNDLFDSFAPFVKERIEKSSEAKLLFWDSDKLNDEFEKELEQAQTKWKSIEEVEAWVQKAKQQSEVSEDEAKQVFATTETME